MILPGLAASGFFSAASDHLAMWPARLLFCGHTNGRSMCQRTRMFGMAPWSSICCGWRLSPREANDLLAGEGGAFWRVRTPRLSLEVRPCSS
jgi:hypothetical protein